MELTLPPEIPVTRVVNGHNVFNKGYHHAIRGKTYEEYYGEEMARKMKEEKSRKMKGHRFWGNANAACKKVVAIRNGKIIGMFTSAKIAAESAGVNYATMRRYLKKKMTPKNNIQWFYEKDNRWTELLS